MRETNEGFILKTWKNATGEPHAILLNSGFGGVTTNLFSPGTGGEGLYLIPGIVLNIPRPLPQHFVLGAPEALAHVPAPSPPTGPAVAASQVSPLRSVLSCSCLPNLLPLSAWAQCRPFAPIPVLSLCLLPWT